MSRLGKILLIVAGLLLFGPLVGFIFFWDGFVNWINNNEPFWLFCILFYEGIVGTLTLTILVEEFFYDKEVIENKGKKKKKVNRDKVKVEIDADGNARIVEAPKDLDVSIDHLGKD